MSSPVEQIKSRLDIADVVGGYVRLQKAGINLKGLCPFHQEKTPSFFVSPSRQSWHCFGCNAGGDIFSFLQKIEGIDFSEALRILAQRAGVLLRHESKATRDARARLFDANEAAAQFYETQLEKSVFGQRANAYLLGRGLREETMRMFRLGWAPDRGDALHTFLRSRGFSVEDIVRAGLAFSRESDGRSPTGGALKDRFRGRIMFPILDGNERVIGFTGRIFGREEGEYDPKYLNTPETPIFEKSRVLYGLHAARRAIRREGRAIFVEGQMDCLMAHQAGTANVIATSGTALTSQHLALIKRLAETVVFAYDADRAGIEAAKRGIELALEAGLSVRIAVVPSGKDPADLIRDDPGAWATLVHEGTQPIIAFLLDHAVRQHGVETVEGKRAVAAAVLPTIARVGNAVERGEWVKLLALHLRTREEAVWEELGKYATKKSPGPVHEEQNGLASHDTKPGRRQLLEEHLLVLALLAQRALREAADLFTVPVTKAIYPAIVATAGDTKALSDRIRAVHAAVSEDHRPHVERLAFAAEALAAQLRDIDAEIAMTVRELRALEVRDRLDAISLEIEAAERVGDHDRARELIEQFRKDSSLLSSLFAEQSQSAAAIP